MAQWISADDGGTMTQAEVEFANIERYFMAKGIPTDIARKCAWQADWTDEEYEVMMQAARSK
ncbi:hypothetical protein [Rossellomorea sp. LjRoot5]|uniref:hypothetical protein n=1 Tax=Rossellomorea sp. LjRoot5 TaxID=3342331 RepID=UPI003ED11553